MWPEIYNFLEQFSGVEYDFGDDLKSISGYTAFIEPYQWKSGIDNIMEDLEEALDCVEDYAEFITDDLPRKKDLKKIITMSVLSAIISNLNNVKRNLNIENVEISNVDDLMFQIQTISDLINMLIEKTIDDIIQHDEFDKYDEENDGAFTDLLGIHKNDMTNMSFTVNSIRQDYFETLDEENE